MADLEEIVRQGEGIKDKKLKMFGLRVSGTSIVAAFAFISTIVGTLYGGFLMYQKVEGIANLDLGAISSQMAKTSSEVLRIEEHADAIKIELKKDRRKKKRGRKEKYSRNKWKYNRNWEIGVIGSFGNSRGN